MDNIDIVDIAVETGRQNIAEHSRIWQIAVECRRLRQSRDRSLIAKSVEIGKCVSGVMEVFYNNYYIT